MATHLAAITLEKGTPFVVQPRQTPKPGKGELLIEVKAVALNPADHLMSDYGLFIPTYPTVIGFDISGLVLEIGENVPSKPGNGGSGTFFQPGITRVAAYAASFWKSYKPEYGAFQERCLVPWQHAVPITSESISWNQAATLPVAAQVPLQAWHAMGLLPAGQASETHNHHMHKREALLIWGASSSVGTMGVQTARWLREDRHSPVAAVYAVAGAANHRYVRSLGADCVFDHKSPQVVDAIVSSAKKDGLVIRHCFLATGQLALCQAVLRVFMESGRRKEDQKAKIGSAPVIPHDAEEHEGVETIFLAPSADETERLAQFQYWMGTWLGKNLAKGTIRPSPEPQVVGKGLGAINEGLNMLRQGVSCSKLVIEVAR
ncbi:GroES-like protein [Colletotrichum zoysiae]|uniref:GroES-like protein n=1 Tax=Colletotrichum zoysiae TaxID=1216348 RepID=A0AAD9HAX9_9PEZI|nr:GroES-like protein [Colletotrichum zoysiae]